jgi:hypothetical protein
MKELFVLSLALLLIVGLTPLIISAYERCYYPILRKPKEAVWANISSFAVLGVLTSLLYAATGGSILVLLRREAPPVEAIEAGAITGALTIGAARIWGLTYSHAFARTLYFTSMILVSAFIAVGFKDPSAWTTVTDTVLKGDSDSLTLLPKCGWYVAMAMIITEVVAQLVVRKTRVSYSLLREQFETFERYERVTGERAILAAAREELEQGLAAARASNEELRVDWLTGFGIPEIRGLLDEIADAADRARVPVRMRILCHEDGGARERLGLRKHGEARFMKCLGHYRMLVVGERSGLLGVAMGEGRQAEYPDYLNRIDEPTRIAIMRSVFEKCWEKARN